MFPDSQPVHQVVQRRMERRNPEKKGFRDLGIQMINHEIRDSGMEMIKHEIRAEGGNFYLLSVCRKAHQLAAQIRNSHQACLSKMCYPGPQCRQS
jgi:hypothetical protein